MVFNKLFAPKWKHNKVEVRRQALLALDPTIDESKRILVEVAETDEQGSIRLLAIRQLRDIDSLLGLINAPEMSEVQDPVRQRLIQILCDETQSGIGLAERMSRVEMLQEQKIVDAVAQQAKEPALRLAALSSVQRQGLLGDIALSDPDLNVREQALSRISQRSTLARVVNESRRQDKRINTLAEQRLTELREEEDRPKRIKAEAKRLCLSIEDLERSARKYRRWLSKEEAFLSLCENWQNNLDTWHIDQDGPWNEALTQRFEKSFQAYLAPLEKQRAENTKCLEEEASHELVREEKSQIITSLTLMLESLKQRFQPEAGDDRSIKVLLTACHAGWQDTGHLPDAQESEFQQRYLAVRENLSNWLSDIELYQLAVDQLNALDNKALAMCELKKVPQAKALSRLEQTWLSVKKPQHFSLPEDAVSRLSSNVEKLQQRIQQDEQHRQENLIEFRSLLVQLEKAVDDGKFKHASNFARSGQKLLQSFSDQDVNGLKNDHTHGRFQNALTKVRDLQDWRSWSNEPARVQLCEEIEKLEQQVSSNLKTIDYNAVMQRIKEARNEWRRYDTKEVDESSEVWQRFDDACTKCFSASQRHFDGVHQRQQASISQREEICRDLEVFYAEKIADQAIENVDWKTVEHIINVAEKEWPQLGIVGHRQWGGINKRYHGIMSNIRQSLRAEREHKKESKQLLIKQLQSVTATLEGGGIELNHAIEKIKSMQAQWKEMGHTEKKDTLWREFNTACNAVFDQRKAQREAFTQELHNNLQQKVQLCEQVEQLSMLQGEELKAARAELDTCQQQWHEIGKPPKSQEAYVEKRFKAACKSFGDSVKQCFDAECEAQHALLEKKVELCMNIETLLDELVTKQLAVKDLEQVLPPLQEQWAALPQLPASDEKRIQQRYQKAQAYLDALRNLGVDSLVAQVEQDKSDNLASKLMLCLQLEILAGCDSPPEFKQSRMEYHLAMLAEKIRSGEQVDNNEAAQKIERQWQEISVVPAEQVAFLEKRFKKAYEALKISK